MSKKLKIEDINKLNSDDFLNLFKNVVELWPKAADTIKSKRPFNTLSEFAHEFDLYLENVNFEDKIAILRSHPDLAGKLLDENKLSEESAQEQAAAGLDQLTTEQKTELVRLNAEYRQKFDFPFVICVRQNKKIDKILKGFRSRLPNYRSTEIVNGINEVKKICRIRLESIVDL